MSSLSLKPGQAGAAPIMLRESGFADDSERSRGALGDADPAMEAANLMALARSQARSGRDAEPQSILSLFAAA
jgi:hypothetical protein